MKKFEFEDQHLFMTNLNMNKKNDNSKLAITQSLGGKHKKTKSFNLIETVTIIKFVRLKSNMLEKSTFL